MKFILVDTREKPKAIARILADFDNAGVKYDSSKLYFGDYMDYNKPGIVIDRKQTIAELAKNCTGEHQRFRAELERAKAVGAELVILVEQNRFKERGRWVKVDDISELMLWENPHSTIRGEKIFRVLSSWCAKYNLRVEFCDKRQTGSKIMELIYGNKTK